MSSAGSNVEYEVAKGKLVITVDLTAEGEVSKSGKSIVIASTKGNQKIDIGGSEVSLGLNVYKKKGDA